jgi:hypothetical protein
MVNSISKTVQTLITEDLALQDALQRDYGNYSAIARLLRPKVEEILGHAANFESIVTAVKRSEVNYKPLRGKITEIVAGSIVNIRTDMAKISVRKTEENLVKIKKTLVGFPGEFFHLIEGISAVTVIFDQKAFEKMGALFPEKDLLDKKKNLATIIIRSSGEIIHTPGCVLAFYNTVSRRQINMEETMSCFTDTIMILNMEDVGKAFTALTELITEARKRSKAT